MFLNQIMPMYQPVYFITFLLKYIEIFILHIRFYTGKELSDNMSKDLQEKSDKIIKELKDSLVPLTVEIKKLKCNDNQGN
jgi:hypothetical protein